jgi:stress-induced morphogen
MGTKQRLKRFRRKVRDAETLLTEQTLGGEFPSVEAYRTVYDTIRVRIVDPRFQGKNRLKRDKMVLPLIHALPDEIQTQIIFLLLLAPGEEDASILNFEFENPDHKLA